MKGKKKKKKSLGPLDILSNTCSYQYSRGKLIGIQIKIPHFVTNSPSTHRQKIVIYFEYIFITNTNTYFSLKTFSDIIHITY